LGAGDGTGAEHNSSSSETHFGYDAETKGWIAWRLSGVKGLSARQNTIKLECMHPTSLK
jgi:hypothetical protein